MCLGCLTNVSRALHVLQKWYILWEFQADTLYVCPKPCFGHTYKVSAWNSQRKSDFWHCVFSRDYFAELAQSWCNNPSSLCRWVVPSRGNYCVGWNNYCLAWGTISGNSCRQERINKQRVLMHRHQGWNVRHGLCHIYMRYLYIYELFIAFVCFVVCSLL